jgi:hypothetical protein
MLFEISDEVAGAQLASERDTQPPSRSCGVPKLTELEPEFSDHENETGERVLSHEPDLLQEGTPPWIVVE